MVVTAMLLPLAFIFAQYWTLTGDNLRFVSDERRGVVYLQPLIRLLGALTDAQSAAVRGTPVNVAQVRAAVAAVDVVDQAQGDPLQSRQRWSQLQERIVVVTRGTRTGNDAYVAYAETNDLTLGLAGKIGDTSNLILDPVLDSYYLVDTVLLRLPQVLVDAGRLADLSALTASPKRTTNAEQLAVARDRVATMVDAIDARLRKVFNATSSKTLGQDLLGQLDAFRSAANDLAPSTALLQQQSNTSPDPAALASARGRFKQATLQMASTALAELDALLGARGRQLDRQRMTALAAILLGVLACAAALWQRLPGPSVAAPAPTEDDDEAVLVPGGAARDEDALVVQDLVDARALLQSEELLRVGRAVRSNRREHDDDSQ